MIQHDQATGKYVNVETGEIVPVIDPNSNFINNTDVEIVAITKIQPNGRVRSGKKQHRLIKTKEPFVMTFQHELQQLIVAKRLTDKEMAVILTLSAFLQFDGTLRVGTERMTVGKLDELLGWNRSQKTLRGVLDQLDAKGVIRRVKEGQRKYIDLNPRLFFVGKMSKREQAIKAFEESA